MWKDHSRLPGLEQEDGRPGGKDRVHSPFECVAVGCQQDWRQYRYGLDLRHDYGGECREGLPRVQVHGKYRRPVPHAARKTPLDPFEHSDTLPGGEEVRSSFTPSEPHFPRGEVRLHVFCIMRTVGQGERGDEGVSDATAATKDADDVDEPIVVVLGITGMEL